MLRSMPDLSIIALVALATARITTLLTHDEIAAPLRSWIAKRFDTGDENRTHPLAYMAFCPWCVSVWVAVVLAALVYFAYGNELVYIGLLALAASQVTGMIAGIGR